MEDETQNSVNIPIALLLTCLAYSYFLVSYLPKGVLRVISLVPIFYIFLILPWYSSSSFLRGILSFFITWITSFKLLLLCFNQGLLISAKNYIDFVMLAIFPVKIKEKRPPLSASKLARVPVLLILANLYVQKQKYPQNIIFLLHFLCIIYGFYLLFARYELLQLFNKPYLAKSLEEFWGRRWNRLSSNILRETIYNPCKNRLEGIIGIGPAKVVSLIVTLVVSGIMHELMFYYISCGDKPTWEVAKFFVLHGICMAFERAFKGFARAKRWKPFHPLISNFLTLGFVLLSFYWLLVLPVWRSGKNGCNMPRSIHIPNILLYQTTKSHILAKLL